MSNIQKGGFHELVAEREGIIVYIKLGFFKN